jgi:hypothetical protein
MAKSGPSKPRASLHDYASAAKVTKPRLHLEVSLQKQRHWSMVVQARRQCFCQYSASLALTPVVAGVAHHSTKGLLLQRPMRQARHDLELHDARVKTVLARPERQMMIAPAKHPAALPQPTLRTLRPRPCHLLLQQWLHQCHLLERKLLSQAVAQTTVADSSMECWLLAFALLSGARW